MGRYGYSALAAVKLIESGKIKSPDTAWSIVTKKVFGKGTASQMKGCPRNTFLGLCEEGLVKGISAGLYTQSKKNKKYSVTAVRLLKEDPELAKSTKFLWKAVKKELNITIQHNDQMDVVITLWENDYIM